MNNNPQPGGDTARAIDAGILLTARYSIEQVIAVGGMARVVRAYDRALKRVVAIKTLHPHLVPGPFVDRFIQEGQTLAALSHPNIVAVFDIQINENPPYLIMEYVDGDSLAAILG